MKEVAYSAAQTLKYNDLETVLAIVLQLLIEYGRATEADFELLRRLRPQRTDMDTSIQQFTFENRQEVRVVKDEDGEPWFVAGDVCKALDIANVGNALARLDVDEKNSIRLADGNRGNPNLAIVSEAGLYTLILRSDKSEAGRFKRWITHEVLPAIRKAGFYSLKPMTPAEMLVAQAQLMLDHERRIETLEAAERARQQREQEAEAALLTLPGPTAEAPPKTIRAELNERARGASRARAVPYAFLWNKLYRELKYRAAFDAEARASHSDKSRLDLVEDAGLLDALYAIACEIL